MKEIAASEIEDGYVLAEDVKDERGHVLLSAGVGLSRAHVELLERRGVLTVRVTDPDEGGPRPETAPSGEELGHALARIDHMFEGTEDDPIMRAIHAAARGMIERALPGRTGGTADEG
jgi:hypothetical protein